jgi:hypothetical protein
MTSKIYIFVVLFVLSENYNLNKNKAIYKRIQHLAFTDNIMKTAEGIICVQKQF